MTNGDRLTGGAGSDTFVYSGGDGQDAILDFTSGEDTLQIDNAGVDNFDQLVALGQQDGGATVFDFGDGNSLRLSNTHIDDLSASDFVFNGPTQGFAIPFDPVFAAEGQ